MNMHGFDGKIQVGHKYQTKSGVARCVDDDIVGAPGHRFLLIIRVEMYDGSFDDRDFSCDENGNVGKMEYDVISEIVEKP